MTRRRAAAQAGFTLVEILVALALLSVGVFATVGVLDSSRRETTVAQTEAVASLVGERELERITAQPYAKIALAASPGTSPSPTDPRYFVQAVATASCPASSNPVAPPCYQWDQSAAASAANTEPLDIDGANADATANPQSWSQPAPGGGTRLSGTLWRFVTWAHDPNCSGGSCNQVTGYKRVTVAVTVDNSPLTHPVVLSSLVGATAGGGVDNPLTDVGTTCLDGAGSVACAN